MIRKKKTRGILLTIFLVLGIIINSYSSVMWLLQMILNKKAIYSKTPLFFLTTTVTLIFLQAIWKGKKWGVYGFISWVLITLFVLGKDMALENVIYSVASLLLFVFLIFPTWRYLT